MAAQGSQDRINSLVDGFNSLTEEYQRLWIKSQTLERSLVSARDEFQKFVAERGMVTKHDLKDCPLDVVRLDGTLEGRMQKSDEWWMRDDLDMDTKTLIRIRRASKSVEVNESNGPAAMANGQAEKITSRGSSTMPSISESPLEQDFTTHGMPSKLECPFVSMDNRKLSSHAASVVSKYRSNGSITPRSSVSRINGRASSIAQASFENHPSEPEPGLCGALESPTKLSADIVSAQGSTTTGRCPIRNLKRSSPEEVAAYFEEHKHELPRSHEICVKRYQSNAESIKQLDAKYGNLVSMIQGLGQKHVPMLPETPMEGMDEDDEHDRASDERVRKWARSISDGAGPPIVHGDQERKSHFDREMRDVRIGESPSRPWGIQIPISALEKASRPSSVTAEPGKVDEQAEMVAQETKPVNETAERPVGKCPFGHGAGKRPEMPKKPVQAEQPRVEAEVQQSQAQPIFINSQSQAQHPIPGVDKDSSQPTGVPQMSFSGPVFIGYSVEQAMAVLQAMKGQQTA